MNIAIDYDNTISRDPFLFREIMLLFVREGHDVYVITGRKQEMYDSDLDWIKKDPMVRGVICTDFQAKRKYVEETYDLDIDIWIDDTPEAILWDWDGSKTVGDPCLKN